ncbi:MAG: hypothetical protein HOO67_02605 [Candidatus Peribacteraceae bacterium]|nr:hypothetical protein [Candidatus Peribacteraceae bacterium]
MSETPVTLTGPIDYAKLEASLVQKIFLDHPDLHDWPADRVEQIGKNSDVLKWARFRLRRICTGKKMMGKPHS